MAKINASIVEIPNLENQHTHSYAQIVIPLHLSQFIQAENSNFLIDKSTLLFIPRNCPHKYRSESGNRTLLINIPEHLLKKSDYTKLSSSIHMPIDNITAKIIEVILYEIEEQADSNSVQYLFFYLYDKIVATKTAPSIAYISQHFEDAIPITYLAEIEHYNVNYYREWFKKQTGMRPKEYIQKLRIEKAKELLVTTEYSITEIANQVGYDHSSSFLRVFKATEGITPHKYRHLDA